MVELACPELFKWGFKKKLLGLVRLLKYVGIALLETTISMSCDNH